jgi:hypothetical protein
MRHWVALAALGMLAACASPDASEKSKQSSFDSPDAGAVMAAGSSAFDYRYAFRLPGSKVREVQQSNLDGCEKLGPARCRMVASHYVVDSSNHIQAVLTLKIDPSIARGFGEAVTKTVTDAHGSLVDTALAGSETSAERSSALIGRLREALENAQATASKSASDTTRQAAANRVTRLQSALDTIAEVESDTGQTFASAPVLMTYESSSAILGPAPDANFSTALDTFKTSVAGLANVLAGVGPWLVLMILVVAALRWVVQHTGAPPEEEHAPAPAPSEAARSNMMQRFFNREPEHAEQP